MKMLSIIFVMVLATLSACSDKPEVRVFSPNIDLPSGTKILIAPGGPNYALCCGSCDSNGQCSNCALLPPLSECIGKILACPEGEVITDDGSGSCA